MLRRLWGEGKTVNVQVFGLGKFFGACSASAVQVGVKTAAAAPRRLGPTWLQGFESDLSPRPLCAASAAAEVSRVPALRKSVCSCKQRPPGCLRAALGPVKPWCANIFGKCNPRCLMTLRRLGVRGSRPDSRVSLAGFYREGKTASAAPRMSLVGASRAVRSLCADVFIHADRRRLSRQVRGSRCRYPLARVALAYEQGDPASSDP